MNRTTSIIGFDLAEEDLKAIESQSQLKLNKNNAAINLHRSKSEVVGESIEEIKN
jgi:hypothetical protein